MAINFINPAKLLKRVANKKVCQDKPVSLLAIDIEAVEEAHS